MAIVSHIASLKTSIPFLHFFDGWNTSAEYHKVDLIDYKEL